MTKKVGYMHKIEVWETEDPVLIIWGTHDPLSAILAALDWYEEESEVPEGVSSEIMNAWLSEEGLRWADPAVYTLEGWWPKEMVSRTEVKGWIPYIVVVY